MAKERLADLGPLQRIGLLALAIVAVLVAALPISISLYGAVGGWSALIAAAIVWISSAAAFGIGELFCQSGQVLAGVLVAMFVRMAFPLVACVTAYFGGSRLAEAGFVYFVLAFYLVVLPLETLLSVLRIQARSTP